MCGRYSRNYTWAQVHAFSSGLSLVVPASDPEPAFNVAPTQPGWVLVSDGPGKATAHEMRWGLIPIWSKDSKIAYSTINARVETASTKPAFRSAWKSRRCLIPASGYYEWPGEGKAKQPYYIQPGNDPILMFAGLWERWHGNGEPVDTYTIVTMDAVGGMLDLHDRTPVMLPPELHRDWMEGDAEQAAAIAHAVTIPEMRWHPVSKAVGNVRNQGTQLIEPIELGGILAAPLKRAAEILLADETPDDEIHIDEFTPEILGVTFGEMTPQRDAIAVQLRVRQREGDRFVEGFRDPLLIHRVTLASLADMGPGVLARMREIGADKDVLPPAHAALPAWDAGPSYNAWGTGAAATCNGFGYADFLPDEGAAVLLVTIKPRGAADQTGAYIMSYRAMLALHKAAPKAMRKLDARRH